MKITFTLKDATIQSYLDNYNECEGTNLQLKTLTPKQLEKIEKAFSGLAVAEFNMRCDDHGGFETERYFGKL